MKRELFEKLLIAATFALALGVGAWMIAMAPH